MTHIGHHKGIIKADKPVPRCRAWYADPEKAKDAYIIAGKMVIELNRT